MVDSFDRLKGARTALGVKTPVRAASTGNLTLSGFQTVDGVTFASGDDGAGKNMRILVKDQSNAVENGIYNVQSGDWERAKDFDGNTDFQKGTIVYVTDGTTNASGLWSVSSADPPNVGTDSITFAETEFTAAQALAVGALDALNEIASALKTGADGQLVTGTPGNAGDMVEWNADGDVVAEALTSQHLRTRAAQMVVFDFSSNVETGNGQFYFHVSALLDGMDLVNVHAEVITAGTTNTTDIQIHNVTDGVDMLSTKLTVDSGETGSDTADTPAAIDTDNDDVAQNDLLRIDVDQVSSTPPAGLIVTMEFRLPNA